MPNIKVFLAFMIKYIAFMILAFLIKDKSFILDKKTNKILWYHAWKRTLILFDLKKVRNVANIWLKICRIFEDLIYI